MTFEISEESKNGMRKKQTEDGDQRRERGERQREGHQHQHRDPGDRRHRSVVSTIMVSGQCQMTLTLCPERRMTRGGRRDGAPSQTQIMKTMITMNEGVIILLLSRENMKGTPSQGRVKVSLQLVWICST